MIKTLSAWYFIQVVTYIFSTVLLSTPFFPTCYIQVTLKLCNNHTIYLIFVHLRSLKESSIFPGVLIQKCYEMVRNTHYREKAANLCQGMSPSQHLEKGTKNILLSSQEEINHSCGEGMPPTVLITSHLSKGSALSNTEISWQNQDSCENSDRGQA